MFFNFEGMNDTRNHHAKSANHPWFEKLVELQLVEMATNNEIYNLIKEVNKQLGGNRLEAEGAALKMLAYLEYPIIGPHKPYGVTVMKAARGLTIRPSLYVTQKADNDDTRHDAEKKKLESA